MWCAAGEASTAAAACKCSATGRWAEKHRAAKQAKFKDLAIVDVPVSHGAEHGRAAI
jgi:hypothetical protein